MCYKIRRSRPIKDKTRSLITAIFMYLNRICRRGKWSIYTANG
ncbi:hypothetical protein [Nostoc sp.]